MKTPPQQHIEQLASLMNAGNWAQVVPVAQHMTRHWPQFNFGWAMLGAAWQNLGQSQQALAPTQKALALAPREPQAHSNLGNVLMELQQTEKAVECFQRAIALSPAFMQAHYNLANALSRLGQYAEALQSYDRALSIEPRLAAAHCGAAEILMAQGLRDEALARVNMALEVDPSLALAHRMAGELHHLAGGTELAWNHFLKALQLDPKDVVLHADMSKLLAELRRYPEAVAVDKAWVSLAPGDAFAHYALAQSLRADGQLEQAVQCFRAAIAIRADIDDFYVHLGLTLNNLADPREAQRAYRQALALNPKSDLAFTNLLFAMAHDPMVTQVEAFEEVAVYARKFEQPLMPEWPAHANLKDPNRIIQVGFVSADLRNHAVSVLLLPVLEHLCKTPGLNLHAYSTHKDVDIVTDQLRTLFHEWHEVAALNPTELADQVRADGIDILVDLSGHTAHNRLLTFARKPAPLQGSWLGFPGSTGLRSMDYYFADTKLLPHDLMASQFTEKLVYLPATNPFQPSAFVLPVNPLPALSNGYVTYGSFNRPAKIGSHVIALWARLLKVQPNARLLMVGVAHQPDNVDRIRATFAMHGVEDERVTYLPRCGIAEYLKWHQEVDICLDTFPYNGGTTTSNALTMGVPTLTLAGERAQSRGGAELMGFVDLVSFVGEHEQDFIDKGLWWAQHLDELAALRAVLRQRLADSPMGHPELIAEGLANALRTMWRRWCMDLPPVSFSAELHDESIHPMDDKVH